MIDYFLDSYWSVDCNNVSILHHFHRFAIYSARNVLNFRIKVTTYGQNTV